MHMTNRNLFRPAPTRVGAPGLALVTVPAAGPSYTAGALKTGGVSKAVNIARDAAIFLAGVHAVKALFFGGCGCEKGGQGESRRRTGGQGAPAPQGGGESRRR